MASMKKSISDLADVHERFGSATATFFPHLTTNTEDSVLVNDLVSLAKGNEKLRSVVVKYDATQLLATTTYAPPRIASVDPVTNKILVVYPVGDDGKDVFPSGVHHSKSVACIVWRENEAGDKQVL